MDSDSKRVTERLRSLWRQHPGRMFLAAASGVVLVALLAALPGLLVTGWQVYELKALGLTLQLPAEPASSPAGLQGEAGRVYRAGTPELAVLISGNTIPRGAPVQARFMVDQAMNFVGVSEGIENLAYEVTQRHINGRGCLHVSGTFLMHEAPSRLSGLFFFGRSRHCHVICLYNTEDGASAAERVLASVRFSDGSISE